MRCLFFNPPGRVELRELHESLPQVGEAMVEVLYSGVSPGTELRCLSGKQEGAPTEGFIPGYQCVGKVLACPGKEIEEGRHVFLPGTRRVKLQCLWGGHVSHAVAPVDTLFPLSDGLNPLVASFAKLGAISYNGVQLAGVQLGERVAVIGLGPIGFFSAQILSQAGHLVTAYDLSSARVETAALAGIVAVLINRDQPVHKQVASKGPLDVIIDCTGVPTLLSQLLLAGKDLAWGERSERGLRYLVQGSCPADISIPYMAAFMKELMVLFPRDNRPSDVRAVLELMGQGKVGLPQQAVQVLGPVDAQGGYNRLFRERDLPLSMAFQWK